MNRYWSIVRAAAVALPLFLMATGCQRSNSPSPGSSQVSPGNPGSASSTEGGDKKPSADTEKRPEEKRGHIDVHVRPHDGVDVEVEREPPKPADSDTHTP